MGYEHFKTIDKSILDTKIQVGKLVKINDWKKPLRVVGVSENYFVMKQNMFGKVLYSVCEKKPWGGIRHNSMIGGMFHCGTDNMVFGFIDFDYKFDNEQEIKRYLNAFESEEIELSHRKAVPIYDLYVK